MVAKTGGSFSARLVARQLVVLSMVVEKTFLMEKEILRLRHHVSVLLRWLCMSERRTVELEALMSTTEQVESLLREELTATEEEVAEEWKRAEVRKKEAEVAVKEAEVARRGVAGAEEKVASATKEKEVVMKEAEVAVKEAEVVRRCVAEAEEKVVLVMKEKEVAEREAEVAKSETRKVMGMAMEEVRRFWKARDRNEVLQEKVEELEREVERARKEFAGTKRIAEGPDDVSGVVEDWENSGAVGRVGILVKPGKVIVVEETKPKKKGKKTK
ncbi:hypothetical protein C7212DRAFT_340027 [Tuber magnatum]|uniref:Uncharacterized protein n=1 Tax=Tuber magnatum TaxID=42249 RepID=A0A317T0Z4_9PEZI|nr:hypothetical protein C7212DRAFT_340027 [Tuber magnatum]